MAKAGSVGKDQHGFARTTQGRFGQTKHAFGGHHRFAVQQDHGKGGTRGYDFGKKINGRKRHILVDTNGLVLKVKVHPANVQDRAGAKLLLEPLIAAGQSGAVFPRLRLVWADRGYTGALQEWMQEHLGWRLDIASYPTDRSVKEEFWDTVRKRRQAGAQGAALYAGLSLTRSVKGNMKVVPRRWVVERTFAWLGRNRRMSKDYESLSCSGEALIYLAMIRLMLKRLAKHKLSAT